MTPEHRADPATLLSQHAETTRLLGVDFLPVRRPKADGAVEAKPSAERIGPSADTSAARAPLSVPQHPKQAELDALRARYEADAPHATFVTDFTNIVFGEGDPDARLMFVGEAPGAEEDKTGRPFVGRAGELLNKMIVAMGLTRAQVYIANVLKTRPPGNATPTTEEARLCAPYLFEQIAIVQPEVIVTLGLPASRLLLESTESMGRLRAVWAEFPPPGAHGLERELPKVAVMPTYHPAYLLRSYTPDNRKKVWSDLKQVVTRLGL